MRLRIKQFAVRLYRRGWRGLLLCGVLGAMVCEPLPPVGGPPTGATPIVCTASTGQTTIISVSSTVYRQAIRVSVYVPPCYAETLAALPVMYLLHGGYADETQWPDLNVQAEADALIKARAAPFLVVMPGGDYYAGMDYGVFILDEVVPAIERQFRVKTSGADRTIGGLSLGGYWALKIGFANPQFFAAVGAYSPVVDKGLVGDPLALAQIATDLNRLRIQLDVGDMDDLRGGTLQLAEVLQSRGVPYALSINPGGHARPYWRTHTGDYLRFSLRALTLPACHRSSYQRYALSEKVMPDCVAGADLTG